MLLDGDFLFSGWVVDFFFSFYELKWVDRGVDWILLFYVVFFVEGEIVEIKVVILEGE